MDHLQKLGITEIDETDIHAALNRFAMKWEDKAGRASQDRISRF